LSAAEVSALMSTPVRPTRRKDIAGASVLVYSDADAACRATTLWIADAIRDAE